MSRGRGQYQQERYLLCLTLCRAVIRGGEVIPYDRLVDAMEKLGKDKLMDLVTQLTLDKNQLKEKT